MNKGDLRDRTRQLAGAELDGLRSTVEMDVLVEEAYRQVGLIQAWKWREAIETLSTVAATDEYTVPTGIDEPQGLTITDAPGQSLPVPLKEVPVRDILTRVRRDEEDLPRFYARIGERKIRLAPIPDKVYTVEFYGQAPLQGLAADAAEPEWDSRFHAVIAYLAAAVLLSEEGQEELARARQGLAEAKLAEMHEFYQVSKDNTPVIIGGGQMSTPVDRHGRLWPWR